MACTELAEEDGDIPSESPPRAAAKQPFQPPAPARQPAVKWQPAVAPMPGGAAVASPFAVRCPYPGCTLPNMEAFMFPHHVTLWHTSAIAHNYACPVCALDLVRIECLCLCVYVC